MSTKTQAKKPKWSVINFKKIESVRNQLGFSKSAMAEAMGVTNSTYHNWRRGSTIPHLAQQEQIVATIARLQASEGSASPPEGQPEDTRAPGTAGRRSGDVGGGSDPMPANVKAHPMYPVNAQTVPGIAAITSAWISAYSGDLSAGLVYEFIEGLKEVLPGT